MVDADNPTTQTTHINLTPTNPQVTYTTYNNPPTGMGSTADTPDDTEDHEPVDEVNSVKDNINKYDYLAKQWGAKHGLVWIPEQDKGTAKDLHDPQTDATIEVKHDQKGQRTGNIAVEVRQTKNDGDTWAASGLTPAIMQSNWMMYRIMWHENGKETWYDDDSKSYWRWHLWFRPYECLEYIMENLPWLWRERWFKFDGPENSPYSYTKGFAIPIQDILRWPSTYVNPDVLPPRAEDAKLK